MTLTIEALARPQYWSYSMFMHKTYKISNSNGLTGPAWDTDYATWAAASEAIRRAYQWDEVMLSDSYSLGNDYGTGDASAVSAYQSQADCDADPDGAHAPRIVEIARVEAEVGCEHTAGLDSDGACVDCDERCSLASVQDGACTDSECQLHGAA